MFHRMGLGIVVVLLVPMVGTGMAQEDRTLSGPVGGMFPSISAGAGWATAEPIPPWIATQQTVFVIPFRIVPAQDSSQQPVEVQLYVSTDQGGHWQLYDRVRPGVGKFLVRTTGEGEYWFLVRTVDRAGRVRPQSPPAPEMRVVVDTTPPKLELAAERNSSGGVILRWKMTDRTLRPETLRMMYRTGPGGFWQSLPLEAGQIESLPDGQEGLLQWMPPPGVLQAELRAEVADAAGNLVVAHALLPAPASAAIAALNAPSNFQQEQWRATRREVGFQSLLPEKPETTSGLRPTGSAASVPPPSDGNKAPSEGPSRTAGEFLPAHLRGERASDAGVSRGPVAGPVHPPIQSRFASPAGPTQEILSKTSESLSSESPATGARSPSLPPGHGLASPRASASASAGMGSVGNPSVSPPQSTDPAATAPSKPSQPVNVSLPPGATVRMVNSRVFELEYELGMGNAPGRVELWATSDGGRTWQCWGQDTDHRSPMIVSVPEEGIYGFRVMVSADSRNGTAGPAPGELPDVWIGADWTRPTGRILAVEPNQDSPNPQVVIRWEAADRYLADRPISLFFSPTGTTGSWKPIATDVENTGQYTWQVPAPIADRIYIRLEIRDRAGNLTVDQTREAISIGPPSERAKIRDVRPVNPASKALVPGRLS